MKRAGTSARTCMGAKNKLVSNENINVLVRRVHTCYGLDLEPEHNDITGFLI